MERYINEQILKCIARPQKKNYCSIAALTCVINYLYFKDKEVDEFITPDEIIDICKEILKKKKHRNYGNKSVKDCFDKVVDYLKFTGEGEFLIRRKDILDKNKNKENITNLYNYIKNENSILVYHTDNHYCIICGFFESSKKPNNVYKSKENNEYWFILADHSLAKSYVQPVRSKRWKAIKNDIRNDPDRRHCILKFEKNNTSK